MIVAHTSDAESSFWRKSTFLALPSRFRLPSPSTLNRSAHKHARAISFGSLFHFFLFLSLSLSRKTDISINVITCTSFSLHEWKKESEMQRDVFMYRKFAETGCHAVCLVRSHTHTHTPIHIQCNPFDEFAVGFALFGAACMIKF